MARELFVNPEINLRLKAQVEKWKEARPVEFKAQVGAAFVTELKKLKSFSKPLSGLYMLGSFSRGEPSFFSDLDLLYLGPVHVKSLEELNQNLRKEVRSHSLRVHVSLEELFSSSDVKGWMSCFELQPLFEKTPCVRQEVQDHLLQAECQKKILEFVKEDHQKRKKRYGVSSGVISYHIKNSIGGVVQLYQIGALDPQQDLQKSKSLLYKTRVLNQAWFQSDKLNVFSYDEATLKGFFEQAYKNEQAFLNLMQASADPFASLKFQSQKEKIALEKEILKCEGLIRAPRHHIYTLAEHLRQTLIYGQQFFDLYQKELELNSEELNTLLWACVFHDIAKQEGVKGHSERGAEFVKNWSLQWGWDEALAKEVAWLVKEHLTFVKHTFKSDPYDPVLVQRLLLKGCKGSRAKLLFVLSCADIVSTNLRSWSEWKKQTLYKALKVLLGQTDQLKIKLKEHVKENPQALSLIENWSDKELGFVPYELLEKDLGGELKEGFAFYEHGELIWIRCHFKKDELGLAKKVLSALGALKANVQHAFFNTLASGEVYNWIGVFSGVSVFAFEKRFLLLYHDTRTQVESKPLRDYEFKIRVLSDKNMVISLKGPNRSGLLLDALSLLNQAGLNILWGHAVTWGKEVEDVFGVEKTSSTNLSLLPIV